MTVTSKFKDSQYFSYHFFPQQLRNDEWTARETIRMNANIATGNRWLWIEYFWDYFLPKNSRWFKGVKNTSLHNLWESWIVRMYEIGFDWDAESIWWLDDLSRKGNRILFLQRLHILASFSFSFSLIDDDCQISYANILP